MSNFGLTDIEKPYLKICYRKLYETMLVENKLKEESIILSFLNLKSNVRHDLLENSSISNDEIPNSVLKDFLRNNLIRDSDEINKYILTAKGIWIIEEENRKISLESIIDFLDEKFFDVSLKEKGITDKEKVILFSMISARTFSENSPVDLKKDEFVLDAWKRIIDSCNEFLGELKVIKGMDQNQLYGKKGNEHIVSNLIRHTDSLPKKIKRLYNAPGDQKYFLDLYNNNKLSPKLLEFIFRVIFESKEYSLDDVEGISEFCQKIAYDEAPHIHDIEKHEFASPIYDDIIIDALKKVLI